METIEVNDLYHAAYLLMNGKTVEEVRSIPVAGSVNCTIRFIGEEIDYLTEQFLSKRANVNLYAFRQAYMQITSFIYQARQNAKKNGKNGKGAKS